MSVAQLKKNLMDNSRALAQMNEYILNIQEQLMELYCEHQADELNKIREDIMKLSYCRRKTAEGMTE